MNIIICYCMTGNSDNENGNVWGVAADLSTGRKYSWLSSSLEWLKKDLVGCIARRTGCNESDINIVSITKFD